MINWDLLYQFYTSPLAYVAYALFVYWVIKVCYNLYRKKKHPEEFE